MLLPPHFFFVFLYYTDVGSLTLVLAAYLVRRRARPALQRRLGALHASVVNSCAARGLPRQLVGLAQAAKQGSRIIHAS